jgi:hypothetical protein
MSSTPFFIKQGDTSPAILVELTPADTDLTGATEIVFNMRQRNLATTKISRAPAVLVSPSGPAQLRYDWSEANGDTDTDGDFEAEFEVTRSDGSVETFPNDSYIDIIIRKEIA